MNKHNAFDTIENSEVSTPKIKREEQLLYYVSGHNFNDDLTYLIVMHVLSMAIAISSGYQQKHSIPGRSINR